MHKLVSVVGALALCCVSAAASSAAQFHCRAVGLAGAELSPDVETFGGFAEIRPEKQFDLVIDTDRLLLIANDQTFALSNLKGISNETGTGLSADIESVAGTLYVRYRETDDFFAFSMGGYQVAGTCPRRP